MATTAATAALSMKLLIDRKAQRVLFAEASKEVVDFLFSLLALPVATAVKLVRKEAMVGCVGYASVDKLDSTYLQAGAAKDALLCPVVLSPAATTNSSLLRLPAATLPGQPKTFYRCNNTSHGSGCRNYVTDVYSKACPTCGCSMTTVANYVPCGCSSKTLYRCTNNYNCRTYITDGQGKPCPHCGSSMTTAAIYLPSAGASGSDQAVAAPSSAKGFVQGIVTYTVLDDLTVTPMSTISGITLLNTFAVKDLGDLQETTVQLGYNEGLAILKASLQSKTVLTDVFLLHGKAASAGGRA